MKKQLLTIKDYKQIRAAELLPSEYFAPEEPTKADFWDYIETCCIYDCRSEFTGMDYADIDSLVQLFAALWRSRY